MNIAVSTAHADNYIASSKARSTPATMSKQRSTLSKQHSTLYHSTMLLRHCCWCGPGLRHHFTVWVQ